MSEPLPPYEGNREWPWLKDYGLAGVEIFKQGARMRFVAGAEHVPPCKGSGKIRDQSTPSRHRAAFAFLSAECTWLAMSVLTWRAAPDSRKVKSAVRQLRRRWRERWGEPLDAWLMEMQMRGVPHYHLFHAAESNFGVECRAAEKEHVERKGQPTTLVRGEPDLWLRSNWMDCIDDHSPETRAFNGGGIIELTRSPDGVARYVAKEASKREQKVLPERYSEGLGRWWWMNKRWAGQGRFVGEIDVSLWPFEHPMKHVWDAEQISDAITDGIVAERQIVLSTGEIVYRFPYKLTATYDTGET